MKKLYSHIIWDWNGTLFNDVQWCVDVENVMLVKRGMKPLADIAAYHSIFCFPVIKYYENVGFDLKKESFEALSAEYIELYHANKTGNCSLHENTKNVLSAVQSRQIEQIILSASQIDNLLSQISEFDITPFFSEILGISDIYARSKIDIGKEYMKRVNPEKAIMIGDTVHDFEVAQALGVDCLLVAKGHQSRETLAACPVPVLNSIEDVLDYIV